MKKYKYVVTVGCSFTVDPPHNSNEFNLPTEGKSYGRLIAEHFGAKYYELATCGYSIQGMNRRTLEWSSKNKDKFKDTLIIVGMTSVGRIEIWNNKLNSWHNDSEHFQPPNSLFDQFKDHLMIYWTAEQRKNYFVNFYNDNAEFLLATNIIIGLQSFLTLNNIDHVFFDAMGPIDNHWDKVTAPLSSFANGNCYDKEDKLGHKLLFDSLVSYENWYKHPEWPSMAHFTILNPEMRVSENDSHPNKKAHKYWADCLLEYIEELI